MLFSRGTIPHLFSRGLRNNDDVNKMRDNLTEKVTSKFNFFLDNFLGKLETLHPSIYKCWTS